MATRRFPVRDGLSSGTKGAVEAVARALAAEEGRLRGPRELRRPGMLTDGIAARLISSGELDTAALDITRRNIPLRRFGEAKDIAEAVAFLASDRAGFITGQALGVDSGCSVRWPGCSLRRRDPPPADERRAYDVGGHELEGFLQRYVEEAQVGDRSDRQPPYPGRVSAVREQVQRRAPGRRLATGPLEGRPHHRQGSALPYGASVPAASRNPRLGQGPAAVQVGLVVRVHIGRVLPSAPRESAAVSQTVTPSRASQGIVSAGITDPYRPSGPR